MGTSVWETDTTGLDKARRWVGGDFADKLLQQRELKQHPFAGAWDQLTPEAQIESTQPRRMFKTTDFGNGHREVCVWLHAPNPLAALDRAMARDFGALPDKSERGEGDLEANRKRAIRRAKQKVRHACKAMRVNSLWTLTYRANVVDRERVLRDLDRFRRAVVSTFAECGLGAWQYIAVLERQERGAYHVHLATHALPESIVRGSVRVKSWNLMRAIWHRIVGVVDGKPGGNFDEAKQRRRPNWSRQQARERGAGAIAAYIAGYVAKDMEDGELNRKRYSVSKGIEGPAMARHVFPGDACLRDLVVQAYEFLGQRVTRAFFDPINEVFFAESDDSIPIT